MKTGDTRNVFERIRSIVAEPIPDRTSDRDLLRRFADGGDRSSFELLVRRHGPMVLGVCRRVLRNGHDAEDAYQSAFLVLARKAGAFGWQESVGNWLYVVARRLALRYKYQQARRHALESHATTPPSEDPQTAISLREAQDILDEELGRLPTRLRAALVLCCLEGATRDEAAQQLGWSLATLKRRLEHGRKRLRQRLQRRGLTLSATLAGVLMGGNAAPAALPFGLMQLTVKLAMTAVQDAKVTGIAASLATLLSQMWHAGYFFGRIPAALAALAVLAGAAAIGVGMLPHTTEDALQPEPSAVAAPQTANPALAHVDGLGDPLPPAALMRLGSLRWRQNLGFQTIAFATDGKALFTSGDDGNFRVWDRATGKVQRQYQSNGAFAVSPDGKSIASANSKFISLLEPTTGKRMKIIPCESIAHSYRWLVPVYSPDGRHIAAPVAENAIAVFDISAAKEVFRTARHSQTIECFGFAGGGKRLVTATGNRSTEAVIRTWDCAGSKEISQHNVNKGNADHGMRPMCFSPDGTMLALEGAAQARRKNGAFLNVFTEYRIHLADCASGRVRKVLDPLSEVIWTIGFSPDSARVACQRMDGSVEVWDTANGAKLFTNPGYPGASRPDSISTIAFSPDGRTLATVGNSGVVHLFDALTGQELESQRDSHHGPVARVEYSPNGSILASAGSDHTIVLWDAKMGRARSRLRGHTNQVKQLAFSPGGRLLASSAADDTVRLWNTETAQIVSVLKEDRGQQNMYYNYGVRAVTFTPDEKAVLAWGEDVTLRRWDVRTGSLQKAIKIKPSGLRLPQDDPDRKEITPFLDDHISAALFTPDARTIILASNEWIWLFDIEREQQVLRLPCIKGPKVLTLSPDGRYLAAGSWRGALAIWELATGHEVFQRGGDSAGRDMLTALAFSPDSRRLVIAQGSSPDSLTVLDLATGETLPPLTECKAFVRDLTFSPNGKQLASALGNSTVLIWDGARTRPKALTTNADLSTKELESLWADLAGTNGKQAYAAGWRLASQEDKALSLLKNRVRPAAPIAPARLQKLFSDLDNSRFAEREKASLELKRLGRAVEKPLRELLSASPSPEVRRRVESILAAPPPWKIEDSDALRRFRVVGVLESIATDEARQLLKVLAVGDPAAIETQQAQAAIERLRQ